MASLQAQVLKLDSVDCSRAFAWISSEFLQRNSLQGGNGKSLSTFSARTLSGGTLRSSFRCLTSSRICRPRQQFVPVQRDAHACSVSSSVSCRGWRRDGVAYDHFASLAQPSIGTQRTPRFSRVATQAGKKLEPKPLTEAELLKQKEEEAEAYKNLVAYAEEQLLKRTTKHVFPDDRNWWEMPCYAGLTYDEYKERQKEEKWRYEEECAGMTLRQYAKLVEAQTWERGWAPWDENLMPESKIAKESLSSGQEEPILPPEAEFGLTARGERAWINKEPDEDERVPLVMGKEQGATIFTLKPPRSWPPPGWKVDPDELAFLHGGEDPNWGAHKEETMAAIKARVEQLRDEREAAGLEPWEGVGAAGGADADAGTDVQFARWNVFMKQYNEWVEANRERLDRESIEADPEYYPGRRRLNERAYDDMYELPFLEPGQHYMGEVVAIDMACGAFVDIGAAHDGWVAIKENDWFQVRNIIYMGLKVHVEVTRVRDPYRFRFPIELRFVEPNIDKYQFKPFRYSPIFDRPEDDIHQEVLYETGRAYTMPLPREWKKDMIFEHMDIFPDNLKPGRLHTNMVPHPLHRHVCFRHMAEQLLLDEEENALLRASWTDADPATLARLEAAGTLPGRPYPPEYVESLLMAPEMRLPDPYQLDLKELEQVYPDWVVPGDTVVERHLRGVCPEGKAPGKKPPAAGVFRMRLTKHEFWDVEISSLDLETARKERLYRQVLLRCLQQETGMEEPTGPGMNGERVTLMPLWSWENRVEELNIMEERRRVLHREAIQRDTAARWAAGMPLEEPGKYEDRDYFGELGYDPTEKRYRGDYWEWGTPKDPHYRKPPEPVVPPTPLVEQANKAREARAAAARAAAGPIVAEYDASEDEELQQRFLLGGGSWRSD